MVKFIFARNKYYAKKGKKHAAYAKFSLKEKYHSTKKRLQHTGVSFLFHFAAENFFQYPGMVICLIFGSV